jgi:hypothetical protein
MESFDRLFDSVFGTQSVTTKSKKQAEMDPLDKYRLPELEKINLQSMGNLQDQQVISPNFIAGYTKRIEYVTYKEASHTAHISKEMINAGVPSESAPYSLADLSRILFHLDEYESKFRKIKKYRSVARRSDAVTVIAHLESKDLDPTTETFDGVFQKAMNTLDKSKQIEAPKPEEPKQIEAPKPEYTEYDAVATQDFKGGNDPRVTYLTFKKGAQIHVTSKANDKGWEGWLIGTIGKRKGTFPAKCIEEELEQYTEYDAVATQDFKGGNEPRVAYLTFKKGAQIHVTSKANDKGWEGWLIGTIGKRKGTFPAKCIEEEEEKNSEAPVAEAPSLRNPSPASIGNSELAPQTGSTTNNTVVAPETYEYQPLKKNLMDHYKDKTGNELQYLVNGNHVEPEVLNDVKASMRVKLIAEAKEARDRQMADDEKTLETIADDEAIDPEKLMGLRNSRRKLHKIQEDVFETPNRFDGFTTGVDEWSENPLERNIQVADRYYRDGMPSVNEVMYNTARKNNKGEKALKRIGTKTAKQQMSQMHDYSVYNMANAAPTMTSQKINQPLRRCDDNVNNSAVGPDDYLRALFRR